MRKPTQRESQQRTQHMFIFCTRGTGRCRRYEEMKSSAQARLYAFPTWAEIASANLTLTVAYKCRDNDVMYRVVRR
jgi:hypothetical protein